jgi:hypothetical protein
LGVEIFPRRRILAALDFRVFTAINSQDVKRENCRRKKIKNRKSSTGLFLNEIAGTGLRPGARVPGVSFFGLNIKPAYYRVHDG